MNKFLKLTGVSMLAIVAATGANAAGYTCEELIEYTSCNPGYYLNVQSCDAENQAVMYDVCLCNDEYYGPVTDKSECTTTSGGKCEGFTSADFEEMVCLEGEQYRVYAATRSCNECPAGSICTGGTVGATTCPAGSYCATAGLSQPTGKCNIGTYSTGGATAATCTSCPATGLTDKDGKTVVATTSSTGSTSASACFVGDDVEFKDDKGIWHYNNTCKYGSFQFGYCTYAYMMDLGEGQFEYYCDPGFEVFNNLWEGGYACTPSFPQTESQCNQVDGAAWNPDAGECTCDGSSDLWSCDLENNKLYCEM